MFRSKNSVFTQLLGKITIVILFLSMSSCVFLSKAQLSKLSKVQAGQSQAEVIDHLGKPDRRRTVGNGEIFYYNLYSEDANVYPYMARFEKGLLVSIESDSARAKESRVLQEERRNSNQYIHDYTGTNKAPPLKDAQTPGKLPSYQDKWD